MKQSIKRTITVLCIMVMVSMVGCEQGQYGEGGQVKSGPDYLATVKEYADAMLEHGRDRYGAQHSPLFSSALDRTTLSMLQIEGKPERMKGIRNGDRMLKGANPMHDQDLYQVLYALTEVTGDKRYAREADKALKWFFENCQSPETNLLTWGEHIGWGFETETLSYPRGDNHEFYGAWVLWDRSFELAPQACERYALGLWEHQVHDHETGDFSRHAMWKEHRTGIHNGYPRHGGFYIATWGHAYERTKNPVFLKAIETLVDHYNNNSSPNTGAIPCSTNPGRITIMWPESNLSLAVDLWDAAAKVPDKLAKKMRARALKTDELYLSLKHEFGPEGRGFVAGANVHTLERLTEGAWTDTDVWAMAYGKGTDADVAMLCSLRYAQVKHDGYKKLVLDAANRYLTREPILEGVLYPEPLANAILLMLACHELTGQEKYLERADYFAENAMRIFFDDSSPLPKVGSTYNHYESMTGGDDLLSALLKLWAARNRPGAKLPITFNSR